MTGSLVADDARGKVRVLVCGGRDYFNREKVFVVLDRFHEAVGIGTIIHGAARGADSLADEWALARGVAVERFPAAWATLGRAAGALRNARMLRDAPPHQVIAFPGGHGTADMIRRAERGGFRVLVIP